VIYSSGSVAAQKLLLQYTTEDVDAGDLRGLVSGWYDTVNAGVKNEASSYARIVREEQHQGGDIKAEEWAFFSDNVREVEAAKKAGLKTVLTVRPGNAAVPAEEKGKYRVAETFEDVKL